MSATPPPPEDALDPAAGHAAPDASDAADDLGGDAIPMLTDVVRVSRYDASELPPKLAEVDWSDLSRRIQDHVMQRLLRRSEAMLDGSLQEALDLVLERHLHAMQRDLSDSLSQILRDLVARAVAEELARVHAEIARREAANGNAGQAPTANPPERPPGEGSPALPPSLRRNAT